MRILFVRHGQDDDSRRGGWSSYGLLEEGHLQAKSTAAYLKDQTAYTIGAIFASDLKRTVETASWFSDALKLPVKLDPGLREINNGVLAGMPNREAAARYPGLYFSTLEMDEPFPGGESPGEFCQRVSVWLSDFLEKNRDRKDDILVVTHGGVIKVIHHLVKELEWTNKANCVPTDKCSIHILNVDTMTWEEENRVVWR